MIPLNSIFLLNHCLKVIRNRYKFEANLRHVTALHCISLHEDKQVICGTNAVFNFFKQCSKNISRLDTMNVIEFLELQSLITRQRKAKYYKAINLTMKGKALLNDYFKLLENAKLPDI